MERALFHRKQVLREQQRKRLESQSPDRMGCVDQPLVRVQSPIVRW